MARFYFQLRDGTEETLDPEGVEFADMKALKEAVLDGARDLLGNDVRSGGVMDLRFRIDAENDAGEVIHSLPFKDAVRVIPAVDKEP